MAATVLSWILAIPLLGVATGCRAMTPIAVVCWFAWLRLLPVQHTWAFWTANIISVAVFTLFVVGETIGDKLSSTPSRISPGPLVSRLAFGGLVGAIVATSLKGSIAEGALLGTLGAFIGAFSGYHVRHFLVSHFKTRDWPVAVLEDFCVVLITVFALRLATT